MVWNGRPSLLVIKSQRAGRGRVSQSLAPGTITLLYAANLGVISLTGMRIIASVGACITAEARDHDRR